VVGVPVERRVEEFKKFIGLLPPAYRREIHLLPVVPNGKAPAVPKGTSTLSFRMSLEDAIERLKNGGNVAIMFHAPKVPIFAVDIDVGEGKLTPEMGKELLGSFPETLTVQTPHGGYHLYYMATLLRKPRNAKYKYKGVEAGEVRVDNYYVLAPGSVVDGKMYTIIRARTPHAIDAEEFPQLEYSEMGAKKLPVPEFKPSDAIATPDALKKYKVPNTVWTFEMLLHHDPLLRVLLQYPVDGDTPVRIYDKDYPSQSEIDAAILSRLSYYGVPEQDAYKIIRAFRYRPKLDRSDYLPRTWQRVSDNFAAAQQKYDPKEPLIVLIDDAKLERNGKDKPVWQGILEVLPKDHFVREFVEMGRKVTDAYPEYHIGAALWALSVAVGPDIRYSRPFVEDPRLYMLFIGRSAYSHKSTSAKLAKHMLEETELARFEGANEFSAEGFLSALQEKPRMWVYTDEASKVFKLFSKQYAADLEEAFLLLFNRIKKYRRRLSRRNVEVANPWFAWLGCTTFSNFENSFSEGRVMSGFFSRVLFVAPRYQKEVRPFPEFPPEAREKFDMLAKWLSDIHMGLTEVANRHDMGYLPAEIAADAKLIPHAWAMKRMAQIEAAGYAGYIKEALGTVLERYQEYLVRIALLVHVGRRSFIEEELPQIKAQLETGKSFFGNVSLVVTKEDMDTAYAIIDRMFYRYAQRLLLMAISSGTDSNVDRVYRILLSHGGYMKWGDLLRASNLTGDVFRKVIETLDERGDVKVVQKSSGRGRPATYVILPEVLKNESD